MKATEALQLNAFLAALTQLDGKLPVELQNQLNDIGKEFPASVSKLGTLAKSYSPLDEIYKEARRVLRSHEGERLRFTTPEPEEAAHSHEEDIISVAIEILNFSDSVTLAKRQLQSQAYLSSFLFCLEAKPVFGARCSVGGCESFSEPSSVQHPQLSWRNLHNTR
jgi:hypothetical protein